MVIGLESKLSMFLPSLFVSTRRNTSTLLSPRLLVVGVQAVYGERRPELLKRRIPKGEKTRRSECRKTRICLDQILRNENVTERLLYLQSCLSMKK